MEPDASLSGIECELKNTPRFNPKSLKIEKKNKQFVTSGW